MIVLQLAQAKELLVYDEYFRSNRNKNCTAPSRSSTKLRLSSSKRTIWKLTSFLLSCTTSKMHGNKRYSKRESRYTQLLHSRGQFPTIPSSRHMSRPLKKTCGLLRLRTRSTTRLPLSLRTRVDLHFQRNPETALQRGGASSVRKHSGQTSRALRRPDRDASGERGRAHVVCLQKPARDRRCKKLFAARISLQLTTTLPQQTRKLKKVRPTPQSSPSLSPQPLASQKADVNQKITTSRSDPHSQIRGANTRRCRSARRVLPRTRAAPTPQPIVLRRSSSLPLPLPLSVGRRLMRRTFRE